MGLGDRQGDLGEVHPGHQPQPAIMRGPDRVAEQIAARALPQVGIRRVERQLGRVVGQDAAGVDQPGVGAVVLDRVQDHVDVEPGVDLPQVGLKHLERAFPPSSSWPGVSGHVIPLESAVRATYLNNDFV
jgi:hypothetical protein